jgi:hypothetical protein
MPATNGARLSRVHSSSVKSAFDVMQASSLDQRPEQDSNLRPTP